jgi:hypothetical protein
MITIWVIARTDGGGKYDVGGQQPRDEQGLGKKEES